MTAKKIPKILVVEDYVPIQQAIVAMFCGRAQVLSAHTKEQAILLLKDNPDVDLITMDGNVPKKGGNKTEFTGDLVVEIRAWFKGRIIAASLNDSYSDVLMGKGCSHRCPKMELPKKIGEVLGI